MSHRCALSRLLVALSVAAAAWLFPASGLAQGGVRFNPLPDHFPAQLDGQPIGAMHGGAATDRAGNVYVSTDTDRGILVFGRDGKYLRCFGPRLIHGLHLQREADGEYLYAARPTFHEVLKIRTDGTVAWTLGYPEMSQL
jgi:hypothetical protein